MGTSRHCQGVELRVDFVFPVKAVWTAVKSTALEFRPRLVTVPPFVLNQQPYCSKPGPLNRGPKSKAAV